MYNTGIFSDFLLWKSNLSNELSLGTQLNVLKRKKIE